MRNSWIIGLFRTCRVYFRRNESAQARILGLRLHPELVEGSTTMVRQRSVYLLMDQTHVYVYPKAGQIFSRFELDGLGLGGQSNPMDQIYPLRKLSIIHV